MSSAQKETEQIFGFDDVEYADDSNFIQMSLPCLRILIKYYVLEGRFYGLEANEDKTALVDLSCYSPNSWHGRPHTPP